MPEILLYSESPITCIVLTIVPVVLYVADYPKLALGVIILLLFLLFFYRHYPHDQWYSDNVVVCPCDGKVTDISYDTDHCYISIFLSVINAHTQMYPINGVVSRQFYDKTGIFDLVIKKEKSKYNEKVIHDIQTKHGEVIMTQISGFLPRCIVYEDKVGKSVQAGDYLGMIKFGSRIDLKIPTKTGMLLIRKNQQITFGDLIYEFKK
jgi:phosphatidylserine decarboxylase